MGGRAAHEGRSVHVGVEVVAVVVHVVGRGWHDVGQQEVSADDARVSGGVTRAVPEQRQEAVAVLVESVEPAADVDAVLEELLLLGQRTAVGGEGLGLRNGGVKTHAVATVVQDLDRDLLTVDLDPVVLNHGAGVRNLRDLVERDPITRLRDDVVTVLRGEVRAHADEEGVLITIPHVVRKNHGDRKGGEEGAEEEQIGTGHDVTWERKKFSSQTFSRYDLPYVYYATKSDFCQV